MAGDNISRVAVVGTGQMGPGIGVVAALAGCQVTLIGRTTESLERGRGHFGQALAFLVQNRLATPEEADAATARLALTCDMAAATETDMVIESIVEHLPTKQEFFRTLDALCPSNVILATNTSGLRITDIAALMEHPERAVITHFYNPGHLIPLVEVVQGERTSEDTVQRAYAFLKRCHKRPVIGRKDVPGQIANRLQQAVMREAIYMVQEGIASAEDVEIALKAGPGLRWPVMGPLEHLDNVGLDLGIAVQSAVVPSLCNAAEPGQLLKDLVAEGHLGVRTGQGFHDWSQRDMAELVRKRNQFVVDRVREAREAGEF
jgi:3-hydroxybutyryl-CoA dehydrogenase